MQFSLLIYIVVIFAVMYFLMIRPQQKRAKQHRELIQFGRFYRLQSPFESNVTSWMVVSKYQKEAIVGWYRVLNQVNVNYQRIVLQGLNADYNYRIDENEYLYGGDELMNIGLITSDHTCGERKAEDLRLNGDFTSRIFHLKAQ